MLRAIRSYMPTVEMPKLATPRQMANNVSKLALTAITFFGVAYAAQQAAAGPLAYATCVSECAALTLGGFLPLCLAACAPFLAAPTP